jgi:mRNA interferase MazF
MAITFHPPPGTILVCDFSEGFKVPEMVKRQPVVVISPQISGRPGLCTVVALSTSPPAPIRSYHCKLTIDPPLPRPWDATEVWVKGDMILAAGFHRLDFVRTGREGAGGARSHRREILSAEQLRSVRRCILHSLGLFGLTKHL